MNSKKKLLQKEAILTHFFFELLQFFQTFLYCSDISQVKTDLIEHHNRNKEQY